MAIMSASEARAITDRATISQHMQWVLFEVEAIRMADKLGLEHALWLLSVRIPKDAAQGCSAVNVERKAFDDYDREWGWGKSKWEAFCQAMTRTLEPHGYKVEMTTRTTIRVSW